MPWQVPVTTNGHDEASAADAKVVLCDIAAGGRRWACHFGRTNGIVQPVPPPKNAILAVGKALPSLNLIQQIRDVTVRPGVNVVDIGFYTPWPTVPIVEVRRSERIHPQVPPKVHAVFPLLGGLRQVHLVRIEDLEPKTRYGFIIRAGGGPGSGIGLATATGRFYTGSRSARVVFEKLIILQVSDNEMVFKFALYDSRTEEMIGQQRRLPAEGGKLESGRTTIHNPFPTITLPAAPPSVRLYVLGHEYDDDWEISFGLPAVGEPLVPTTTPTPRGIQASDDTIFGDALDTKRLGEFPAPPQRQDFVLGAIDARFAYQLVGFIESTVRPYPLAAMPLERAELTYRTGVSRVVGQIAAVPGKGGKAHMFTLGPDGGAYRQMAAAPQVNARKGSWRRIGDGLAGPLTVIADKDGGIDLFAPVGDGSVLHGRLTDADDELAPAVWECLEADVSGELFTVRDGRGAMHLFALDRDGAVRHLALGDGHDGRARRWDTLGGRFSGSLFAVAGRDEGVDVFVYEPNRGVVHARWAAGTREDGERGWTPLGRDFTGPAFAHAADDGSVVVVGFTDGTPAFFKTLDRKGQWHPAGDAWARIEVESARRPSTPHRQRRSRA